MKKLLQAAARAAWYAAAWWQNVRMCCAAQRDVIRARAQQEGLVLYSTRVYVVVY
jgi:hypothetical protein